MWSARPNLKSMLNYIPDGVYALIEGFSFYMVFKKRFIGG